MQGDNLVTENVLTRSKGLGDGDGPGVAIGDQVVRGPVLGGGVVQALLVDLEEREVAGGGLGAVVTVAPRHVVEDGTVVRLGPGVPLELNLATSSDLSSLGAGLAALL